MQKQANADKQLLLINDICGYGKVALSAMLPVLSHMGFRLHNLPTALVSNTLNYPAFYIQDNTEYIRQTLPIWEQLGFTFDAISTGFIVSQEQALLIRDFCAEQAEHGVQIFVDPIMGDNGSLYAGVPESTIAHMQQLVAISDVALPNYTEACLLTGTPIAPKGITAAEADALVDALRTIGAKSVVITSATVDGERAVVGYSHLTNERFILPFDEIDAYFPGSGDIFSSVLMGRVLSGAGLQEATQSAMNAVRELIRLNVDQEDKPRGLPIESYLEVIDNA